MKGHRSLPARALPSQQVALPRIARTYLCRNRATKLQARALPWNKPQEKPSPKHDGPPPTFKLPLAVALAGSAFEAYLEPTGAEGFQEKGANGSEITFTDQPFLSEACQGVLFVELQSAQGLRVADITGSSDPYAVISVGPSTAKSTMKPATLSPTWNESFFLYVRDMQKDMLQVRLFDADWIGSDDDLGVARTPLSALTPGSATPLTLPLSGPGGQGTVTLKVTVMRFSDYLLDAMTSDGAEVPAQGGPASSASGGSMVAEVGAAAAAARSGLPLPDIGALKDSVLKAVGLDGKPAATPQGPPSNPWKVLARMAGWKSGNSWSPVAYVANESTDTQVWLYRNTKTREAVVAFRGTEQVKWKDFATDLNLVPSPFNAERAGDSDGLPLALKVLRAVAPTDEVQVHNGFLTAYDSVKPQVFRLLDDITKDDGGGQWQVRVTGHSLGGALATLCAYELATRRTPVRARQDISLYTYGAPRVGNKAFATRYNAAVPDSWRITNTQDIIPSVPRLLGYAHVAHSVRLLEGGRIQIERDSSGDVFGEGKGGLDVINELAAKVTEEAVPWEDLYEEIKSAELAILDSLLDGSALEQHMEDYYLAALQQVVLASTGGAVAGQVVAAAGDKDKGSTQ